MITNQIQTQSIQNRIQQLERQEHSFLDLDQTDSVAILGDRDSGKSNLMFYLSNNYHRKKQKVLYGYPIEKEGYVSISNWQDLLKTENAVILIDEIQKYIKTYLQRANIELMELLSMLKHQNNTIVFTTPLSQFITKGIEASIQTWLIKQLDIYSLKNGSKPKRIIQNTASPRITSKGINLKQNEYLAYDPKMPIGFNKIHTFPNQHIQKEWRGISV